MKRFVTFLAWFLICTTTHAQKLLVPVTFDPRHDEGQVAVIDTEGLAIFVESLEVHKAAIVFDVEVRNLSLQPLHINPGQMHMMASKTEFPVAEADGTAATMRFENSLERHYALKEREVEKSYHASIRSNNAMGTVFMVMAAGLVAFDMVKDIQDIQAPFWSERMARNSTLRDIASITGVVTADLANKKFQLENESSREDLHYLEQEILLETNLEPMEAVRGKVFFPREKARYYRILLPIDDKDYIFDFRKARRKECKSLGIPSSQSVSTLF